MDSTVCDGDIQGRGREGSWEKRGKAVLKKESATVRYAAVNCAYLTSYWSFPPGLWSADYITPFEHRHGWVIGNWCGKNTWWKCGYTTMLTLTMDQTQSDWLADNLLSWQVIRCFTSFSYCCYTLAINSPSLRAYLPWSWGHTSPALEWLQLDVRENAGKAQGRIRGTGIRHLSNMGYYIVTLISIDISSKYSLPS